jgi:branched-chain amino acid transport system permease protein
VRGFYFLMGGVALATVAVAALVARSKFGLRLLALREDEVGAEMMGVNTTAYKLGAFCLSAVIPGIAGGIDASRVGFIEPISTFNILITIQMIIMTMFGGRATVLGPVIGAVVLSVVREVLWARYPYHYQAVFGFLIVGLILFMPEGVMGMVRARLRARRVEAAGGEQQATGAPA